MGGASSKAARQFPKLANPPAWPGARSPSAVEVGSLPRPSSLPHAGRRASETRTEAIEQDSRDPHFLAKLNQLGPVNVDHHMRTYQPAVDLAKHVYEVRRQSEVEARSHQTSHNHILTTSLTELIDEFKATPSPRDLETLARKYDIDIARLRRLQTLVNSPTVDQTTVIRSVGSEGEEKTTMKVMWSEAQ